MKLEIEMKIDRERERENISSCVYKLERDLHSRRISRYLSYRCANFHREEREEGNNSVPIMKTLFALRWKWEPFHIEAR